MGDSDTERDKLIALNEEMRAEEQRGDAGVPFFRELLDQTLRFRRASGAIVTREEFLIDLANPANRRDRIDAVEPLTCQVYENSAVASVLLHVVGQNGANAMDGLFRNIRIFHRDTASLPWRLKVWFNDPVPPPSRHVQ